MNPTDHPPAVDHFIRIFDALDRDHISLVSELYTEDIEFIDPVHRLRGLAQVEDYFRRLYDGVDSCRFRWQDVVTSGNQACITWTMSMVHRRFRPGIEVTMPGISHLRLEGTKVSRHQDYFDMGVLIYERIPLLGGILRSIKKKL